MIYVKNLRKAALSFPGTGVKIGRGKTELSPESYGKIKHHKLFTTLLHAGLLIVEEHLASQGRIPGAPEKKRSSSKE